MTGFLFKAATAVAALLALAVAAGVSGFTFHAWPTTLSDRTLSVSADTIARLTALRAERKFELDKTTFYFGAPNEPTRASAQAAVDRVIATLIAELPASPRRSVVLRTFKASLSEFNIVESEERDQFLVYLERIMTIVGVESSGELFNVWRYGFPYGWILRR